MLNHEWHWGFNVQPAAEDVTAFTSTFVALAPDDYDDDYFGCEAMIGQLNSDVSGFWLK
ncbi:MAG TPA: hypothetical protein VF019_09245 [Nitrospira sp.]